MSHHRPRPFVRTLAAAACLALVVTACGDDDDTEAAAGGSVEQYCTFVEELDSQDGPPTNEQMERIKEIRPDEIGEDIDFVADAFIAADGDIGAVFSDPAVEEAFGRIEAFDAEHCGFEMDEDEEEEQATEPTEGAEVVEITGVDFAFEGVPDEVPAGPVSLGFTNEGEAGHEMMIFKLGEGADMDELLARDEEPSDEEAQEIGGVFAAVGEGPLYVNADLEPATYAMVCFIPGPEGKAHHELGMKATFTVS